MIYAGKIVAETVIFAAILTPAFLFKGLGRCKVISNTPADLVYLGGGLAGGRDGRYHFIQLGLEAWGFGAMFLDKVSPPCTKHP